MIGMTSKELLVSLMLCGLTPSIRSQVSFEWEQRASLPSSGRWGAYTFAIGGYGYVVGGDNGNGFRSDVWRYDPATDSWEQRASMPGARRHGTSWSLNGKGYVVCGQSAVTTFSNMLWEYDPVMDSWTARTSLPGTLRYGTHGFALNGYGYVGGGNSGSASGPYLSDLWRWDPTSDQWTQVSGIPGQARYGSTPFVIGNLGYVHGGRAADLSFINELWQYDPVQDQWQIKPTMPGPGRSWSMVMPFSVDAVAGCGAENGVLQYDAYRYLPSSNTWSTIPDYPGASGWSGASFALQGRVFGGLGRVLSPVAGYHNDWWELVKIDLNGMNDIVAEGIEKLQIHPVPVVKGSSVRIGLSSLHTGQLVALMLSDASGRTVLRSDLNNGSSFSLEGVAEGVYQVSIHVNGRIVGQGRLVVN